MNKVKFNTFQLTGLKLPRKTFNEGGRSAIDCGALWQKFNAEKIKEQIRGKAGDELYAVYYDYEGDHTKPYSYFIGCKVTAGTNTPMTLDTLLVSDGNYLPYLAKGKMPDCVADAWREIWNSGITRAYKFDFEVYGAASADWNDAAVDIYISI